MGASASNKALARYLLSAIGGVPTITRYRDEGEVSSVDIMRLPEAPATGIVSYATLGLSDHSIARWIDGVPLGVEFVMAAEAAYECAPNILSTCAFNIINSHLGCEPGRVFPHVVEMYRPASPMKHILFVPAFIWKLETQVFPEKQVAWLQAVPISEGERAFAREKGHEALEDLMEARRIDVADLDRLPVV